MCVCVCVRACVCVCVCVCVCAAVLPSTASLPMPRFGWNQQTLTENQQTLTEHCRSRTRQATSERQLRMCGCLLCLCGWMRSGSIKKGLMQSCLAFSPHQFSLFQVSCMPSAIYFGKDKAKPLVCKNVLATTLLKKNPKTNKQKPNKKQKQTNHWGPCIFT